MNDYNTSIFLERIANALERIAPPEKKIDNINSGEGFIFDSKAASIKPIIQINRISLSLLQGIDHQKQILLENTLNFAQSFPANNALLWGARGTGKSSLVKAIHAEVLFKTKSKAKLKSKSQK